MSITAKDIAKELNITPAAVSLALNNKPGVSDETRIKVFEAANRLGFKFSKKMLRRNHKMIAFVFFHRNFIFETQFFSELGTAVERELKDNGYHLNAYHIHYGNDIDYEVKKILEDDAEGMIILGTIMTQSEIGHFNNLGIPTVLLDATFYDFDSDTVVINNVDGAFVATDYLIQRCKECPGYIRSNHTFPNLDERANGFYNALRKNGYHTSKAIIHSVIPSIDGAYGDMLEIINNNEELSSCYFCDNDEIALGAIRAFKEKGYRIPEDISIVGFDNMYYSQLNDPPLTSISVPKKHMGKMAAATLINHINNQDYEHFPLKIEINTKLIIRKSVK